MAEDQQVHFSRGDVVSRRYEIEESLGQGMTGTVYLARHMPSGKHLAIKFFWPRLVSDARDRQRFERAFEKASKVRHSGVIRYGELGEHNGMLFVTEEYFPSENLRQLIDRYRTEQRFFTLQEACQIVLQVLDAVEQLHAAGIIHRDLKPENVLVASRNTGPGGKNIVRTVKICDAGVADLVGSTIFAESYVNRAAARYLAPELSSFDQAGTAQSDVYSCGVMLYELLVGQTPRGTYLSPTQIRSDLPDHIDDIVEVALAANPEDRYPTPRDMLNDIQRSFSGEIFTDTRGTSVRNVLIGLGIALAVIAAAGIWLGMREKPDPLVEAQAEDDALRKAVQAKTRMPSEAELQAMVQLHPDMLYIPAGPFVMGRLHQEDLTGLSSFSEPLAKVVNVDAFYIDRFEFPNRLKDKDGNFFKPVARVTAKQAEEACEKIGKRLCTEEEWEKACKGPSNWIYSYGDTYDPEMCGPGVGYAYHLGQWKNCISGYGVWGLSGGLREWTSTAPVDHPTRRVVKGGLRGNPEKGSRCAFSVDESVDYADNTLSFRCCLDVDSNTTDQEGRAAEQKSAPPDDAKTGG